MMINTSHWLAKLAAATSDIERAMILVEVFDAGIFFERKRTIDIIQRHAIKPAELVQRIRKPLR